MLSNLTKENFDLSLSRFSTAELERMIEKFPYFHEAHLLLAKKYQDENNNKFDQQLQLAALYTQDRELFYEIFNKTTTASVKPETEIVEEQLPLTSVTTSYNELAVMGTETSEPVAEEKTAEQFETATTETDTYKTSIELEGETLSVDQSSLTETISPDTEQFVQPSEEPFNTAELHTFHEWLKAFAQPGSLKTDLKQPIPPIDNDKLDDELEKLYLTNIPLDLKDLVEEETHYSKGLDKFIEEQIDKKKTKPVTSKTGATYVMVTETMAKIYEQQKKYSKAIECYSKLALLHPEKNDFFVARINYLKPLL